MLPAVARADTVDLAAAVGFGTGVSLAPGEDGATIRRTPTFFDLDLAGALDIYPGWEWSLGVGVPFEGTPALAFTPRVRRLVERWGVDVYVSAGVPAFVAPYTLVGLELGLGGRYPATESLEAFATAVADAYFAGSDLGPGGSLVMFNLLAGVRVPL